MSSETLLAQAWQIWSDGGWAMIPLAVNAFIVFGVGADLWLRLAARRRHPAESTWRRWLDVPHLRRGPLGETIAFLLGSRDPADLSRRVAEVTASEVAPFARDLKLMRRAVGTAPLLGLLGTVTGMLVTFGALAQGPAGDRTMALIASGISEALITTETGLVIALPGLLFQFQLARGCARHSAWLAHVEVACAKFLFHGRRRELAS